MTKVHYAQCAAGVFVAAVALNLLGVSTATLMLVAAALACPLMMFAMMGMMRHDPTDDHQATGGLASGGDGPSAHVVDGRE